MWSKTSHSCWNRRRIEAGEIGNPWDLALGVISFLLIFISFSDAFIGFILCVEFLWYYFLLIHKSSSKWQPLNSQQVLQPFTIMWRPLSNIPGLFWIVSHAARILTTRSSSFSCVYHKWDFWDGRGQAGPGHVFAVARWHFYQTSNHETLLPDDFSQHT